MRICASDGAAKGTLPSAHLDGVLAVDQTGSDSLSKCQIRWAKRIEVGLYAQHLLTVGLPAGLGFATARRLVAEGEQALQEFASQNLGLVGWEAKRWVRFVGADSDVLFQEGCLGLLTAIRRWDYRSQGTFASYALCWIKEYMHNCVLTQAGRSNLSASTMRRFRAGTLSAKGQAKVAVLAQVQSIFTDTGEILPICDLSSCEDAEQEWCWELAQVAVDALFGLERYVVILRNGWLGKPMNAQQIALELGISRKRVLDLEKSAMQKMRKKVWQHQKAVASQLQQVA